MADRLKRLRERWTDARDRARKRKVRARDKETLEHFIKINILSHGDFAKSGVFSFHTVVIVYVMNIVVKWYKFGF